MSTCHILIVYGTSHGQTAKIADRMERVLTEQGHTVSIVNGAELRPYFSLDAYDGVMIGASILYGHHQHSIEQFVYQHQAALNRMPSAFFSVSGSAASPDESKRAEAQHCVDTFLKKTGWRPRQTALIAGAMAYTKYGPITRFIVKLVSRRAGGPQDTSRDHEYTDWAQVTRFAKDFALLLRKPAVVLSH